MKRTNLMCALMILGSAGAANAASIAINIVNVAESGTPLANYLTSDQTAGVVSQGYWTSMLVSPTSGGNASGAVTDAVDDSGTATTLDATLGAYDFAGGTYKTNAAYFGNKYGWGAQGAGDAAMHVGGVTNSPKIILSQIPYAHYDVYVYMQGGTNGGNAGAVASLLVGSGGTGTVDGTVWSYHAMANAPYKQVSTVDGDATLLNGNYFKWENCTVDVLEIDVLANGSRPDVGTVGFQIVEVVPEPTSLALIGIGTGLVFARRRKH